MDHPAIKYLFPDPKAKGVRYYNKTGLHPINHCVALKRTVAEQHPWVILNIYKAFARANAIADEQRMEHVNYYLETGRLPADARARNGGRASESAASDGRACSTVGASWAMVRSGSPTRRRGPR